MRHRYFILFIYLLLIQFSANTTENDVEWITGQHETLPNWIFTKSDDNTVIAISDPCMTREEGKEQALVRAAWIFSLQNAKIKLLSDVFTTMETEMHDIEAQADKLLSYITLESNWADYEYEIINEHYTLFGEVILQIKKEVTQQHNNPSNSSNSEWMIEYTNDKFSKQEYRIDINLSSSELGTHTFALKGNQQQYFINSKYKHKETSYPKRECWYTEHMCTNNSATKTSDLKSSLWVAFITSLADNLFTYSPSQSTVQYTSDLYNDKTMYNLYREMAVATIKITPQILGINDNKLIIEWEILTK